MTLRFIQYNEPMAGANGGYSDTLNRALRDLLTATGYNPDGTAFAGLGMPTVASSVARDALIAAPFVGQRVWRSDLSAEEVYDGAAWKNGYRLNRADAYNGATAGPSGAGTATTGAPRTFLGTNTPSGDDSALLIGRALNGTSLFSHAVRDESTFTSTLDSAYASYDSIMVMSGATAYNHLRSFQARPVYSGSGTLGEMNGFQWGSVHNGTGVVANMYGLHLTNGSGAGPVTMNVGIWIEALTRGASNYAIYSMDAATPSYHGGQWHIGTGGLLVDGGGATIVGGIHGGSVTANATIDVFNSGGGVVMAYNGGGIASIRPYANGGGTGGTSVAVNINGTDVALVNGGGLLLATGTAIYINATQVVNSRKTGYTAMTGTPDKATAFATSTVTLAQLAGRVMQLQADLTTHGLIGA